MWKRKFYKKCVCIDIRKIGPCFVLLLQFWKFVLNCYRLIKKPNMLLLITVANFGQNCYTEALANCTCQEAASCQCICVSVSICSRKRDQHSVFLYCTPGLRSFQSHLSGFYLFIYFQKEKFCHPGKSDSAPKVHLALQASSSFPGTWLLHEAHNMLFA